MKGREEEVWYVGELSCMAGGGDRGKMAEDGLGGNYNSGCHLLRA